MSLRERIERERFIDFYSKKYYCLRTLPIPAWDSSKEEFKDFVIQHHWETWQAAIRKRK